LSLSIRALLSRLRTGSAPLAEAIPIVDPAADLPALLHWADESRSLRLMMPTSLLVMQGGVAYDGGHPFVRALREGPGALEAFYAAVRPVNLPALYGADPHGPGSGLPPWELPWLNRPRTPPAPEGGLGVEHGVSFYGPASAEKIAFEHSRLVETEASIRRDGYQPERHGDINGHVLRDGDRFRFFVRGGKHRAAVLAHMGWPAVPVAFRPGWPRSIDSRDVGQWPLVQAGALSEAVARAIFVRYFQPVAPGSGSA
jgi:hypothetical protein